jgi:hypothetical protein
VAIDSAAMTAGTGTVLFLPPIVSGFAAASNKKAPIFGISAICLDSRGSMSLHKLQEEGTESLFLFYNPGIT